MTNLEYLIENKKELKINNHNSCGLCYLIKHKKNCPNSFFCVQCEFHKEIKCYEFLNKEYQKPIRLTKFEHDLLTTYVGIHHSYKNSPIYNVFFVELQCQGYFKGINLTLTYEEILERAVVVDDK